MIKDGIQHQPLFPHASLPHVHIYTHTQRQREGEGEGRGDEGRGGKERETDREGEGKRRKEREPTLKIGKNIAIPLSLDWIKVSPAVVITLNARQMHLRSIQKDAFAQNPSKQGEVNGGQEEEQEGRKRKLWLTYELYRGKQPSQP